MAAEPPPPHLRRLETGLSEMQPKGKSRTPTSAAAQARSSSRLHLERSARQKAPAALAKATRPARNGASAGNMEYGI